MKLSHFFLITIFVTFTNCFGQLDFAIDAMPPQAAKNLIQNGDFEKTDANGVTGWQFDCRDAVAMTVTVLSQKGNEASFVRGACEDAFAGKNCLKISTQEALWAGFYRQKVKVPVFFKGKSMRLSAWVKQAGGNAVLRVTPVGGGQELPGFPEVCVQRPSKKVLPIREVFIPEKWLKGTDKEETWTHLFYEFTFPKEADSVYIDLVSYFSPGVIQFDDVKLAASKMDLNIYISGEDVQDVSVTDDSGKVLDIAQSSDIATEGGSDVSALQPQMKANEVRAKPKFRYEKRFASLATNNHYKITVTTSSGQKIEKIYPPASN